MLKEEKITEGDKEKMIKYLTMHNERLEEDVKDLGSALLSRSVVINDLRKLLKDTVNLLTEDDGDR